MGVDEEKRPKIEGKVKRNVGTIARRERRRFLHEKALTVAGVFQWIRVDINIGGKM